MLIGHRKQTLILEGRALELARSYEKLETETQSAMEELTRRFTAEMEMLEESHEERLASLWDEIVAAVGLKEEESQGHYIELDFLEHGHAYLVRREPCTCPICKAREAAEAEQEAGELVEVEDGPPSIN